MREIKFRAWNTLAKKMLHFSNGIMICDSEDRYGMFLPVAEGKMFIGGNYEVMQYTGLKDRKGKEIYEGDILLHIEERLLPEGTKTVVKWDSEYAMFIVCDSKGSELSFYEYLPEIDEVIGNIYENPELGGEFEVYGDKTSNPVARK